MTRSTVVATTILVLMTGALAEAAPAPYDALFQRGKQWKFALDGVKHADGARVARWSRELTCTVDDVHATGAAQVAHVACAGGSDELADANPQGTYVATAAGLWRVDDWNGELASLRPDDMILPAHPHALRRDETSASAPTADANDGDDFGSRFEIRAYNGGWCSARSSWGGDEMGTTLCVRAGDGIIGGSAYFAGGSTIDARWGDAPK